MFSVRLCTNMIVLKRVKGSPWDHSGGCFLLCRCPLYGTKFRILGSRCTACSVTSCLSFLERKRCVAYRDVLSDTPMSRSFTSPCFTALHGGVKLRDMGVSDIIYSRLHDDWFITYGWLGRTFRHIELGTSGYIEAETKMIYRRKLVG